MARINFNTSTKGGGGFSLPPEGTYDFEIIEVVEQDADDEGSPRLYLQLKVADGDQEGAEVRDYHTLSPKRAWTMRNVLNATGAPYDLMDEDEDEETATFDFDTDDLLGRYFRADLTHYRNEAKKRTYPNFSEVQVSPLQEAATAAPPAAQPAPAAGRARSRAR